MELELMSSTIMSCMFTRCVALTSFVACQAKCIVIIILHHTEPLLNDNQLSLGSRYLASLLLHVCILVRSVYNLMKTSADFQVVACVILHSI